MPGQEPQRHADLPRTPAWDRVREAVARFANPEASGRHVLTLPGFTPTPLNRLMRGTIKARIRLAKGDRDVVTYYARVQAIPPATGRRRVSLVVRLTGRQKEPDADAPWKSMLDALVHCKLLRGDRNADVELGGATYQRGERRETLVILEDL